MRLSVTSTKRWKDAGRVDSGCYRHVRGRASAPRARGREAIAGRVEGHQLARRHRRDHTLAHGGVQLVDRDLRRADDAHAALRIELRARRVEQARDDALDAEPLLRDL